jgi:hypothetical protein
MRTPSTSLSPLQPIAPIAGLAVQMGDRQHQNVATLDRVD